MTDKPNNPPAFPTPSNTFGPRGEISRCNDHGLSMRDYFAATALQGLCANPQEIKEALMQGLSRDEITEKIADSAYIVADAMLKAREV